MWERLVNDPKCSAIAVRPRPRGTSACFGDSVAATRVLRCSLSFLVYTYKSSPDRRLQRLTSRTLPAPPLSCESIPQLAHATTLSAGTTASSDRYAFVPTMRTAFASRHRCVDAVPTRRFAATTKRSLHFVFHLLILMSRPPTRSSGRATNFQSRRSKRDSRFRR